MNGARIAGRWLALGAVLAVAGCGGGGGDKVSVSPKHLDFSTFVGNTVQPLPITLTVKGASGGVYLDVTIDGPAVGGLGDFFGVDSNSAVADVIPGQSGVLGPGLHASTVTIRACKDPICGASYGTASFTVTYEVTGVAALDAGLAFEIGNEVAPANLHRETIVRSYPVGAWSVADDADWFTLSQQDTGTPGDTTLNVDLDEAALAAFDNGPQAATITLTPASEAYGHPVELPVTLDVTRTEATYVAPYVAVTGTSDEVIIRGDKFDEITIAGVKFGDQAASAFDVVSATEVRATHPALAAGTYPITLENLEGFGRWKAALTVIDPQPYAAGTLEYPAPVGTNWFAYDMAYDAERRALIVAMEDNGAVDNDRFMRHAYVDGAWQAPTMTGPLRDPTAVALSTNGKAVLASHDYLDIRQLDPVTLATTHSWFYDTFLYFLSNLSVTNHGFVFAPLDSGSNGSGGSVVYSIRDKTAPVPIGHNAAPGQHSTASADGSTIFMTQGIPREQYETFARYDASTGAVTQLGLAPRWYSVGLSSDRRGDRLVVDHRFVLDRNADLLATLADDELVGSVLSADGTRLYALHYLMKLVTYSLAPDGNGGLTATELSRVDLAATPGQFPYTLVLAPDEQTLFIAGSQRIVIHPLP